MSSKPAVPEAPDPQVTAAAQTKSNIATANANANINNMNQVTPWGTQTFTKGTPNADGTDAWTSTIALDPAQQQLLNSNNQISQGMAGLSLSQMDQVRNALGIPMDFNQAPQVQNNQLATDVRGGRIQNTLQRQVLQTALGPAGPIRSDINNAGQVQRGMNTSGTEDLTRSVSGGQIQNQIDMSGVPALVGGDALAGTMDSSRNAAYDMQKAYLDPQYQQRQGDLENKLVQQGVLQNSDAWNRAMEGLGRERTFDYNNAFNNSFDKGLAAQGQLYNQGLSSNQNAFGQATTRGNFANAAQSQGFNQAMANAQLNNSGAGQLGAQRLAQMNAGNAAQGQAYGQNANDAQFANNAQGQQFNQGLAAMQAGNAAKGQQFGEDLAAGQFANAGQAQNFSQGLANAGLQNQASAQAFNQSSDDRARVLNEMLQQQQQPINLLNALRSGSQINAPQFGNTGSGNNVQPTDLASLYNQQYQNQMGAYNSQVGSNNSNMQAGASIAATAAMYFL